MAERRVDSAFRRIAVQGGATRGGDPLPGARPMTLRRNRAREELMAGGPGRIRDKADDFSAKRRTARGKLPDMSAGCLFAVR